MGDSNGRISMGGLGIVSELSNKGRDLFDAGQYQASVSAFQEALQRAQDASIPNEQEPIRCGLVAEAQSGLSGSLMGLGRYRDALTAAEAALAYYKANPPGSPRGGWFWAAAMVNKGTALSNLSRNTEAITVFNEAYTLSAQLGHSDIAEIAKNNGQVLYEAAKLSQAKEEAAKLSRVKEEETKLSRAKEEATIRRPWWRFW